MANITPTSIIYYNAKPTSGSSATPTTNPGQEEIQGYNGNNAVYTQNGTTATYGKNWFGRVGFNGGYVQQNAILQFTNNTACTQISLALNLQAIAAICYDLYPIYAYIIQKPTNITYYQYLYSGNTTSGAKIEDLSDSGIDFQAVAPLEDNNLTGTGWNHYTDRLQTGGSGRQMYQVTNTNGTFGLGTLSNTITITFNGNFTANTEYLIYLFGTEYHTTNSLGYGNYPYNGAFKFANDTLPTITTNASTSIYYTMTFDYNGGAATNTGITTKVKQQEYGYRYTLTNLYPGRTGYTFKTWGVPLNGTNQCIKLGRSYMYTDKIAIGLWAYSDNWSNLSNNAQRLISCTEGGGWNIESQNEKIAFVMQVAGTYQTALTNIAWSSLSAGWHFFEMVYTGSKINAYIDPTYNSSGIITSNPVASVTCSGALTYSANNGIFIGAEAGGDTITPTGKYFKGIIGCFTIRNEDIPLNQTLANEQIATPQHNLTLYAQWVPNNYTLLYDKNGWDGTSGTGTTVSVPYNSTTTLYGPYGTYNISNSTITVSQSTAYYGTTPTVTSTFTYISSANGSATHNHVQSTVDAWYDEDNNQYYNANDNYLITSTAPVVKANWSDVYTYTLPTGKGSVTRQITGYKVTFNTNTTGTTTDYSKPTTASVSPTSATSTRTQTYNLSGYTTGATTTIVTTARQTDTDEILYPYYTIYSTSNGYITVPSTATASNKIVETSVVITPSVNGNPGVTWTGSNGQANTTTTYTYTFRNWAQNAIGTSGQVQPGASFRPYKATTLYAQWQVTSSITGEYILPTGIPIKQPYTTDSYLVEFNGNGGQLTKTSQISNKTVTHTFEGWYNSDGEKRTSTSIVTSAETVYPHFTSSTGPQSAVTLPTTAQCIWPLHKILGFDTNSGAASATYNPGDSYIPNENITLYAIWKPLVWVKQNNEIKPVKKIIQKSNTTLKEVQNFIIKDTTI